MRLRAVDTTDEVIYLIGKYVAMADMDTFIKPHCDDSHDESHDRRYL